ncbi:hypothetical protein FCM35_KLT20004 [Carex littledalei]|uniref:Uncharacterized protein n=1 Tax=Carex littledalei TaxID=544730 RepID=A0A833RCD8_9POAL|nr:hypothetical protein FCM35_KLT20004 [Carex littledalei]
MQKEGLTGAESLVGSGSGNLSYQKMVKIDDAAERSVKDAMLRLGLDSKLSLTSMTCNQLIEPLNLPTSQAQQERTCDGAFPAGKCVKRLIKKTQKAMEAAESEHLFLSPLKSRKRKALTLPLSAKPTRLIVRIPLLNKCGAEMATEGVPEVKGKENKEPDNSQQKIRMMAMNNKERGKDGEKIQRSKLDGDLTPNYCMLPVEVHFLCAMSQKIWHVTCTATGGVTNSNPTLKDDSTIDP